MDLTPILDPLDVPRETKAEAWNAWHSTSDPQTFQSALDSLPLPRTAKADLWDAKYPPAQEAMGAPSEIGAPALKPPSPAYRVKPREAIKPSVVQRPSPATPNPPTAAIPTMPEKPETIAAQLQQLAGGQRKAVMFPKGTPVPTQFPMVEAGQQPISLQHDKFGNVYAYRPDLISKHEISTAASHNKLPDVLGSALNGMGAPDKSILPSDAPVVVVRGPDGGTVQATATDDIRRTVDAAKDVTPPGGAVTIESVEQQMAERAAPPPMLPPMPPPVLPQAPQPPAGKEADISAEQPPVAGAVISGGGMAEGGIAAGAEKISMKSSSGEFFRGDWNVKLNGDGQRQAAEGAARNAGQVDEIRSGTKDRHADTAAAYAATNPQAGVVIQSQAFDPMHMGVHEGERVTPERIAAVNDNIVNRPDEQIPGVGKFSGSPGEAPATWTKRLIGGVQDAIKDWAPGKKTLIVTSGRDTQAIRAWVAKGMPEDGSIDPSVLTQDWATKPGKMMLLDPRTGAVSDVDRVGDGINILRHGETDANDNAAVPAEVRKTGSRREVRSRARGLIFQEARNSGANSAHALGQQFVKRGILKTAQVRETVKSALAQRDIEPVGIPSPAAIQ